MMINELSEMSTSLCQISNDIFIKNMLFYSSTVQIKLYKIFLYLIFSTFVSNTIKSFQNHSVKEVENKTPIHFSSQRTIRYC